MARAPLRFVSVQFAGISFVILQLTFQAVQAAEMKFYQLPPNAYPHDVAPAPDGTVWYTAQSAGFLGRFHAEGRNSDEIPLGRNAAPHGVIVGPDGAAWVTDGGQNAIARVDPTTKAVKLFPLPKQFPDANLNTATFDHDGKLWFTGQTGVHGRVDPLTGGVAVWVSPRPGSYGITTTPSGDVWFAALAGDYIGRIDRVTGSVSVIEPPHKGAGPRRIWSDSKGGLWVSFWNSGGIGRYDPASGQWKVHAMPNNDPETYAVYVDDHDRVWATDWSANAIQRFDPVSEKFDTFPSNKRAASIRQLLGRAGEVWGGESGTGRLVVIRD